MIQTLYDRIMASAGHRRAPWVLSAVAFTESSFFPIPPDLLLVPMCLAKRRQAFVYGALCTGFSVLGGLAGYGIGYFLFTQLGLPILEFYGQVENFAAFRETYNAWGMWIVLGAGLTPFPYKVITIASGTTALDPVVFLAASVLSRGARFFAEAGLLWYLGPRIRPFIESHLKWVATGFFLLLLGGFLILRWL